MPVIREQRKVGPTQPGGVVDARAPLAFALAASEIGATALQVSQNISRVMTDIDTDEAVILAANSKIELDANGVPQISSDGRDGLSGHGQKAYDKAIRSRMKQRISQEMLGVGDALLLEYEGDPEGFKLAHQAAMEGFGETMDPNFQGHFADENVRLSRQYGAQLGQDAANKAKALNTADWVQYTQDQPDKISNALNVGDREEATELMTDARERAQARVDQGLMNQSEADDFVSSMTAFQAEGAIKAFGRAQNPPWTSEDYRREIALINVGESVYSPLLENADARAQVVNNLQKIANSKGDVAAADLRRQERETLVNQVMTGRAPVNPTNAEVLDDQLNMGDEPWATSDLALEAETWRKIAEANQFPSGFILELNNIGGASTDGQRNLFMMYEQLRDGQTPDGSANTSLYRQLPKKTRRSMEAIAGYMRFGSAATVNEAVDMMTEANEVTDDDLTRIMQTTDGLFGEGTTGGWDRGKIRHQTRGWLQDNLEDELDTVLTGTMLDELTSSFTSLVAIAGLDTSDALGMLVKQAKAVMPETRAIYGYGLPQNRVNRSHLAPELVYRSPMPELGGITKISTLATLALTYGPYSKEYDTINRPFWERTAETHIVEMLGASSNTAALDFFDTIGPNPHLIAGEDYLLEPIGADQTHPKYMVRANLEGHWVAVGEIDMKQDYVDFQNASPPEHGTMLKNARAVGAEVAKLTPEEKAEWRTFREENYDSPLLEGGPNNDAMVTVLNVGEAITGTATLPRVWRRFKNEVLK